MNRRSFLAALAALPIVGLPMANLLRRDRHCRWPLRDQACRYARGGIDPYDGEPWKSKRAIMGNGDREAFVPLPDGRKIEVHITGIDAGEFGRYLAKHKNEMRAALHAAIHGSFTPGA